ncbi:putative transcriptional regulator YdeE [Paenibacillus mucilaginosus]|uniref:GyrI-like domain-containing protein n=1 Tax=Paenibacillus mucilaginosus TaxID=61624 RepID=UPI003D1FE310
MNTYTTEQPEIQLIGVSTRTTNAEEAGPNGRLPGLWQTFFKSGMASNPGVTNPHRIYALYTDYESDVNGAYTTLIGHETGGEAAQAGTSYEYAVIPAGKYRVFTSRRGPVFEVVPEAWGEIWAYYKESPEQRAYTGDYELYHSSNGNPADTEVHIYIAIK